LKACLSLSENLPIQYRVKNFTKKNLRTIEGNWETIKESLSTTVRLISHFGFTAKNVVVPLALLPIAFYIMKCGNSSFDTSASADDADAQVAIRKWFIFSTLKNAFGGSSDTTLTRLRELLKSCSPTTPFPADNLYKSLSIEPRFDDAEIDLRAPNKTPLQAASLPPRMAARASLFGVLSIKLVKCLVLC